MADPTPSTNPFPGMDPYLEQRWLGVHTRLITYLADELSTRLPRGLEAEPQERVFIEAVGGTDRWTSPDVHVYRTLRAAKQVPPSTVPVVGRIAVAVPTIIEVPKVRVVERYLQIIDAKSGGRVVTVIEIVSPSNKMLGLGRRKYLQKQREVRRTDASLVEVDLIRGGKTVTLARPAVVPLEDRTPYHVVVRRGWRARALEYYACPLRDRLPVFGLPLRRSDDDVPVDLQSLVNRAYDNGLYAGKLDYGQPLRPPLATDDAAWVAGVLATRPPAPAR